MYLPLGALLFCLVVSSAQAQETPTDSSFVAEARRQAIDGYEQTFRKQAHVYDGHEYITHDHRIKIHPYYRVDSLQVGTVQYNGVQYKGVRMLYDIVRDELAIQPPEGGCRLRLRNEYITAFTIGPYAFTRVNGGPEQPNGLANVPSGFYEVLHDGRVKALAHRVKTVREDISQGFYKADYLPKDRFFIVRDGIYQEVKTKRSLLKLFPEQSKALRRFLRTQNLRFNNEERETAIAKSVQYYETLR